MSVPVSQQNFLEFGVSSTPTLVLLDRDGIVRLYNPGDLPYDELASQIERLL
jgi:thioredoxin-related protein